MSPRAVAALVLLGSFAFGLVAMLAAVHATGGAPGSYLLAKGLFPLTMLAASASTGAPDWALAVAVVQFPAYGAILARAAARGSLRHAAAIVALLHAVAAVLAFLVVNSGDFPN
jgi:hypothetical protein